MIDLDKLRRVINQGKGDVVVTRRWLAQAFEELETARSRAQSMPPAALDVDLRNGMLP